MSKRTLRVPSYCLHKASGQAVVRIDGADHYLGKHGTAESKAEYDRLITEWLGNGRRLVSPATTDGLTVNELLLSYWRWAEGYYRNEHGQPGLELENVRAVLKPLRRLYGHTPAGTFGPLALRAIQEDLAKAGLSRGVVNARVNRVRRVFKWGVSYQLIPPAVYEGLRTVPGLQRGRCQAREAPPVQPAAAAHVNAALPFLPAPVRAMVQLQRLTGCRPGEAMAMRGIDLSMAGPVWTYRPASHKNRHRGSERVIFLGPQAQEVIKPFLTTNLGAFLFSPRVYVEALHRSRHERRRSKRTPSELRRRCQAKPRRVPGERYNRRSYRVAVVRACDKAFPVPQHLGPRRLPDGQMETAKAWWARLTTGEKSEIRKWRRKPPLASVTASPLGGDGHQGKVWRRGSQSYSRSRESGDVTDLRRARSGQSPRNHGGDRVMVESWGRLGLPAERGSLAAVSVLRDVAEGDVGMAENGRTTKLAREPSTAKAVLHLIAGLPPGERRNLFQRLFRHPDNGPVKEVIASARKLVRWAAELQEKEKKVNRLKNLVNEIRHKKTMARCLRKSSDLAQRALELGQQAGHLVALYQKGPQAKAKRKREREVLMRQYRDAGTTDPKKILDALRRDAPDLARVKIKTIQNMLPSL
jgi:integrase